MTEKIAFQLRSENRLTGCITVKLKYTDFTTYTAQKSITYSNQDHIILSTVRDLFTKVHTRRLLIRLIGVRFTDLIPGNYQINLFEDSQEKIKMYQAIDSIKKQFGEKYVLKAAGI
jgi:DNA polymerase-4